MSGAAAAAQPLKILRIIARLNVGGPARHVVLLDRGLRQRGHDTLLLYGAVDRGEASFEHALAQAGIPSRKVADLGRRIRPLGDMRAFAHIIRLTFSLRPDVVHTHTAKAGTLGRLAALVFNATRGRRRRCIVVHTFHGHVFYGYFRPAVNVLVRAAERVLATFTSRIIAISPRQQRELTERFRITSARKTAVIPLGLELDPLFDLPMDAGNADGKTGVVVGYVGRMVPIKNLETLILAFGRAQRTHPHLSLLLFGDGPERGALQTLAERMELSERVRFLGWTDDLTRLYTTIDICALSSLNEGTPVAVIEAMAAGKPVVATAVGGVPDVVEHDVTGLLVPPRDVGALADAIARLATDAALRQAMGTAARRAAARYASERLVTDVEALYVAALNEQRQP